MHNMSDKGSGRKLLWLFGTQFSISAFAFGGGYVVIPLIRKSFVTKKGVFSEEELMDMAAIAQSSPGAIAVNLAVLAGRRTAGAVGVIISCIASILPPLILLSVLSLGYEAVQDNPYIRAALRGMEAGVAALIVDVVIDMVRAVFRNKDRFSSWLMPVTFLCGFVLEVPVILLLPAAAALSVGRAWLEKRKERAC